MSRTTSVTTATSQAGTAVGATARSAAGAATAGSDHPTRPVRRLTGLGPTGHLHLGNLVGAIAPMVATQAGPATSSLVAVVDLHALTVDHRPHEVRALTLEQATTLLAAGLDPDRTTLFVQSHVPEHTELHYLLECVAGYGEAHRMIQFRERMAPGGQGAGAARDQAAESRDAAVPHTRLSLLTYPVLMAADILLHDTDEVPVGSDQAQHLELARDLATRFNSRYGDTFTVPRAVLPPVAPRIRDLADPTAKMGKSTATAAGTLRLLDPPDVLRDKLRRAVTDPGRTVRYDPDGQPGVANLLEILAACTGAGPDLATLAAGFHSYRQLKEATAEAVIDVLAPIQRRYAGLAAQPGQVREILAAGAARARAHAAGTVTRARRAIGLLPD